ncbi:MAG: UDP-N-acetylmuramoyl-L-alanyl-D-glutamate--2,6-diaminopimelate ligase [Mediterranea sp.]|nr:UDP-N-acetylmuramoyl-L-alanyl-D-glutamate--2,6-diaminopimelate ligase [Mediterranea sp.]
MKIKEIMKAVDAIEVKGSLDGEIAGIAIDSRKVVPGGLFVAMRGTQTDGHAYIAAAEEAGARMVVCEQLPGQQSAQVTYVTVKDSEEAAGRMATTFYGNPTERMQLVGVTGTNGKTTIATLLYRLFRRLGYKAGLLSTVCNYVDDRAVPAQQTTPDPITLNRLLGEMADCGCQYAFMEVSSHAIDQRRISGLRFAGAIFTNLTRDHLDYHGTVENYLKAKKRLFDDMPREAFCLTNADDKNGLVMTQNTQARRVATYSVRGLADFRARILESHFDGMLLEVDGREMAVHFCGRFNASNLLAVTGAAVLLGQKEEEVLQALSALHPVAGRFEAISSPQGGWTAIVDYAHTPDALVNVLTAIHDVLQGRGRVLTVVGAGGNRDKGKRPLMAREAVRQSDRLIITSDNPRYEEPQDIMDDMLAGLDEEQRRRTICMADRREAIRTACLMAGRGDVILVAGKGHEDYQEVRGVKHHLDDREEVRRWI